MHSIWHVTGNPLQTKDPAPNYVLGVRLQCVLYVLPAILLALFFAADFCKRRKIELEILVSFHMYH